MPLSNFHSARLRDPDKFKSFATVKDKFGKGIDAIVGIRAKSEDGPRGGRSEIQALRFDKNKFSPAEAKAWAHNFVDKHGGSVLEFASAKVLKESLFKYIELKNGSIPIYKNPTVKDIREIEQENNGMFFYGIRYGVDSQNNIYAWLANIEHDDVERRTGLRFVYKLMYDIDDDTLTDYSDVYGGPAIPNDVLRKLKLLHPSIQTPEVQVMGEDGEGATPGITSTSMGDAYAYRPKALETASRYGDYPISKIKKSNKDLSRMDKFFASRGIK